MIGRRLSHYTVVEAIGAGGMGVVYRARDEHLERDVALKVLPAGALADDTARRRFRKEALALSTLSHPNIATVFDFDTQDGVDFLVMELVPGESLRERLRTGPIPLQEMAELGRQLLAGLAAAHGRGVVHRDLKPENLRVTPEKRLKILDFGLATLIGPGDENATTRTASELGVAKGTLPYMAPEQLRGQAVDGRTDLFAAGAVLYEMVVGRRPFAQNTGPSLVEAILHEAPPAPRSLSQAIPEGAEAVLLKALEKEPKARYQTAEEMLRDLERAVAGDKPLARPGAARRRTRSLWIAATITVLFATLAGVGVYLGLPGGGPIDSLAVLPFENQSANRETDYLSDGIVESIINNVSQVPSVKVIARASSFRFKGRHVEPRVAARALGVRAILTGQVQQRGEELVVSAELIDTSNDRHLWGQRYTSRFSEILVIEEDIARRISEELRLRLTGEEQKRLARPRTTSPEAYDLYLKGRQSLAEGTRETLDRAIEHFEAAIRIDPRYAQAYVGIAEASYYESGVFLSPHVAMPRMRAAAERALQLDGELGEAHAALATVTAFYDWNWTGGEAGFRKALALNPGYSNAHIWYGLLLMETGRPGEAIGEMTRAAELDPLSPQTAWYALYPYTWAPRGSRDLERAARGARRILETDADFFLARNTLAVVYQLQGRHAEAIRELQAAVASAGETTDVEWFLLGHAYALDGRKKDALEIWNRVTASKPSAYVHPMERGLIKLGLGDRDAAFQWLERAFEDRSEEIAMLSVDPRLDDLHDDPRFQSLLRRMGLDQGGPDRR